MSLLEVSGLSKTYTTRFGGAKVEALKSVTFSVESGEYVAVMGESGSGKTTLLNLLAALDRPTGGTVLLGGQNLAEIPEERAAAFRRDHLGFVVQDFSLLDSFSLEDNFLLPLVLQGKSRCEMKSRLVPLADRLGISGLLKKSTPTRSPAARSSVVRVPGQLSTIPNCFWQMNQPVRWIVIRRKCFCLRSRASTNNLVRRFLW